MSRVNSSFSDDGSLLSINQVGKRSEEGKGLSLQVEYSDRGKPNYFFEDRISEQEIEHSERRSTPPGTIYESKQDAMSEHIESSLNKLG